ncbi:methylmalonyl-CoA mutase family protein [Caulobacter segnis]|nr:methylmalonyl-CoA mutase family protein [Caulobacter segnis]MDG2522972.1 methylmalonyl-CoA mutase family protein [Caulobacter segnis]
MGLVDKTLKGADFGKRLVRRTYDGLSIQPLYTEAPDVVRDLRPRDPRVPWDIRVAVAHPDPARANAEALKDLENGAVSVTLRLDPTGQDGIAVGAASDLARVLDGVYVDMAPVALEAGFLGPRAADWLAPLAKNAPAAPLAFHLDPLTAWAQAGISPGPIESHIVSAATVAARLVQSYPKAELFLASGRAAHEAGAADSQELGVMAAAAIAYAKALVRAGLPMDKALAGITLGVSLDGEYFTGVAKVRAAKAIWARITAACGADVPVRIEARSSQRMLSRLDPWTNLLRLTAAGFAGAVGGADAVRIGCFTDAIGLPTAFARRQARNTQLVLMEESALGRVADPAGGAWYLDTLTDQLAQAGWAAFQAIEQAGGIIAALEAGAIQDEVDKARAARLAAVVSRKDGLVGASEFPNISETVVETESAAPTPAAEHPDVRLPGPDSKCRPLPPMRLSEPFEALRDRAAASKPAVFLATLGAPTDYTARLTFARNLFAAGGVAAEVGTMDEYDPAKAALAILCSSDEKYAEEAGRAAKTLKAAGVKHLYLAGKPGDLERELKADGVDEFVFAGMDAVAVLDRALSMTGA